MKTKLNPSKSYGRTALSVAWTAPCASTASAARAVGKAAKLTIGCTATMIADLAQRLAGEAAETHDA